MFSRGTVIAALVVAELAIIGEAGVAINGGRPAPWSQPAPWSARGTHQRWPSGPQLVEDGPPQVFAAGVHPDLTVDVGNADLTILTKDASHVDVSLRSSTAFGMLRATAPIAARAIGDSVRIDIASDGGVAIGDNRMVTVLVPPATRVTVVNAGDITATGLRADASLHSTGSGSVTVEDYNASTLRVGSSNGEISLHAIVVGRLDATSSHDRILGTALQVRDGSVRSHDGATLGFATGADTLVTALTSSGKIGVSGFATATTPANDSASRSDDNEPSSRTVRVGAGEGHFSVHADGDITLAQES